MTVALMGPTSQLVRIERKSSVVISHALNRALQVGEDLTQAALNWLIIDAIPKKMAPVLGAIERQLSLLVLLILFDQAS